MRDVSRRGFACLASLVLVSTPRGLRADEMPLAIKGYDPVAYFIIGRPLQGLPEFELAWDEHRYRFATEAHRDQFRADPARYAPHFSNYCAMALTRSEVLEANPEYWLVSDGKLYLFGKPLGPTLFGAALFENRDRAEQNRNLIRPR